MGQTNYGRFDDRPTDAGKRVGILMSDVVAVLSAGGGAAKVATIVVDTATNSTTYSYTCAAGLVSYDSDVSATKIEISDGLALAHNTLVASGSAAFALADGTDTVTLTGTESGDDFAISNLDANLTLTTVTAADDGQPIPFGVAVNQTGFDACALPSGGTAQVDTLTPTPVHLALYTVSITGDFLQSGIPQTYTCNYQADGTATAGEISLGLVQAINNTMPANSVIASGTTTVILTAENAGVGFSTSAGGDLALAVIAIVNTTANSTGGVFAGVSLHNNHIEQDNDGVAQYAANDPVAVLQSGEIYVLLDAGQAPAVTDAVYYRNTATGTEQLGAFRTTPDGDDSTHLPGARWTRKVETILDGTGIAAALSLK